MLISKITVNKMFTIGNVDKRMYSSFLEHVGRAIYGGIYEPENPTADEHGFRRDVMQAVKELNISAIRYPGGNFVSGYCWEDGIGPRELRPRRRDLAWSCVEPNHVGTDEFCNYCKRMDIEPILAVNLGTRGADDARNLLEYCNAEKGTKYADMRIANGYISPYKVKTWCLGNEMDGDWQIGHKTAQEYGRIAYETAKIMKLTDPEIELVLCGSSSHHMPTFPDWEAKVLEEAYNSVDYISMHSYYENNDGDTASFVASNRDMESFIEEVVSTCDYVKAKKHSLKDMMISYDEWNVWYQFSRFQPHASWIASPSLFEDVYNMEDVITVGGMLITLLRHCDRVKIACIAQLVNVISPIMTENKGTLWKQTTYYPYLHVSRYGRGTVLHTLLESAMYDCKKYGTVPYLESAAVLCDDGSLTVFACNRHMEEEIEMQIKLQEFENYERHEHIILNCDDRYKSNTKVTPHAVMPYTVDDIFREDSIYKVKLPAFSWNVIRLYRQEG